MANCKAFAIWLLLAFSFFLFVDSKKTGAELSSVEEKIPLEIFMKDEPRRQDSNEKSLRAMHLCMEGEDRKERLITCDRHYSSKFACVGAWEGNIQKCDKFNEKQVAAPICVQSISSYVSICEYKNLKPSYLCSPRNLKWMNDYKEYLNSTKISKGLRKDIRPCGNKHRRICLEQGALLLCNTIGQLDSEEDKVDKKFAINTSKRKNSESFMTYETIKSEIDKPLFRDGIPNVSYHTSIVPDEGSSNHKLKYETVDIMSSQTGDSKILHPDERLVAYEFDTNKRESIAAETVPRYRSDIPLESYPLPTPFVSSVISDQGKSNPKLKYKKVNVFSPLRGVSKFSNRKGNIYNLLAATDKTESISGERESQFHSEFKISPSHKSIVSNIRKSNHKLKYKTVNPLGLDKGISEDQNKQESINKISFAGEKLSSSSKSKYVVDGVKHDIKEPAFLTGDLKTPIGLNMEPFKHNYKMGVSPSKEPIETNTSGSPSMKSQWKSLNLKWRQRLRKQIERPVLPERSVKEAEKALARLKRYRTSGKVAPEEPCTEEQSETKRFFYVIKCKDCDIKHTMLVDENAEDVISEVETWTFKK